MSQTALQIATHSDVVLERLMALHPKVIDLTLERVVRLLDRLGNPEAALPPVIHIAGTNGKGSTLAYLRAMLEAAGLGVHVYTSPHLVRFHERIRLAGTLIEEDKLVALLEECEGVNGETSITFFEITTCAAILAYARTPADVLLLETGLGGRLDATNVVAEPRLTIISPVAIDHVQYLGESIEEIAFEKAGILKPGRPAVVAPQPAAALGVIERRAAEVAAPLHRAGQDWDYGAEAEGLRFRGRSGETLYPRPRLRGDHQLENAALALAAAECLEGFALDEEAKRAGLLSVDWPGRLQRLERGPLAALLPPGCELWLDGAHNAAAGRALAAVMAEWRDRPLHLIYGMLRSKAAEDFMRAAAPQADSLHAVAIPGQVSSYTAQEAAGHAAAAGFSAEPHESIEAAVREVAKALQGSDGGRVLICGSLYLVGSVLALSA